MKSTWSTPSLFRVVAFALVIGLIANAFLHWVVEDDWFASVISVGSAVAAVGLVACWVKAPKFLDDMLVLTFMIWSANIIEFALEDGPQASSKFRQCGLYASQALLALGAYVAHRVGTDEHQQ